MLVTRYCLVPTHWVISYQRSLNQSNEKELTYLAQQVIILNN